LRLEDLDVERVQPGMVESTLEDLRWLGLDWDGEPVLQSNLAPGHAAAVEHLVANGLVYPCVCTRRELSEAASAPHRGAHSDAYPGTCRDRYATVAEAERETGRSAALRLRTPPGPVEFVDVLHGRQSFDVAAEVGDFPVTRRDGTLAYQLAVVVDDHAQHVTEVVRGDDLLPSTARQLLLQRALGIPSPSWMHVPLVEDHAGRRLAKREDPLSLATLRTAGVPAAAVLAWAATSAGLIEDLTERERRLPTASAWLRAYRPETLITTPTRLPPDPRTLFTLP